MGGFEDEVEAWPSHATRRRRGPKRLCSDYVYTQGNMDKTHMYSGREASG